MPAQVDINVLVSGLSSANQGLQGLTQHLMNISQAAVNLTSATKAFDTLQQSVVRSTAATRNATASVAGMTSTVAKVNDELGEQQQLSSEAASANIQFSNAVKQATLSLTMMVTDGLLKVGGAFAQIAVKQERYVKSLRSVSKDAAEVERSLRRIEDIAKRPGVDYAQAVRATVALRATGASAEEAFRTIENVSNALVTVGASSGELQGVVRAFTQIQAKGIVFAEEINQIAERLPQIRAAMIDAFGSARTEELQAQGLTAKQFLQGIVIELGKLPKAGNDTANMIENLNNSIEMLQKELGTLLLPTVQAIITGLTDFLESIRRLDTSTQQSILNFGKWTIAIAAAGTAAVTMSFAVRTLIALQAALTVGLRGTATAAGFATAGLSLLAGAIAFYVTKSVLFSKHTKETITGLEELQTSYRDLSQAEKDYLREKGFIERLKDLTEATDDYKVTLQGLLDFAPEYREHLVDQEGLVTANVKAMETLVIRKGDLLREEAKDIALKARGRIADFKRTEGQWTPVDSIIKLREKLKAEGVSGQALSDRIKGNLNLASGGLMGEGRAEFTGQYTDMARIYDLMQNEGVAEKAFARTFNNLQATEGGLASLGKVKPDLKVWNVWEKSIGLQGATVKAMRGALGRGDVSAEAKWLPELWQSLLIESYKQLEVETGGFGDQQGGRELYRKRADELSNARLQYERDLEMAITSERIASGVGPTISGRISSRATLAENRALIAQVHKMEFEQQQAAISLGTDQHVMDLSIPREHASGAASKRIQTESQLQAKIDANIATALEFTDKMSIYYQKLLEEAGSVNRGELSPSEYVKTKDSRYGLIWKGYERIRDHANALARMHQTALNEGKVSRVEVLKFMKGTVTGEHDIMRTNIQAANLPETSTKALLEHIDHLEKIKILNYEIEIAELANQPQKATRFKEEKDDIEKIEINRDRAATQALKDEVKLTRVMVGEGTPAIVSINKQQLENRLRIRDLTVELKKLDEDRIIQNEKLAEYSKLFATDQAKSLKAQILALEIENKRLGIRKEAEKLEPERLRGQRDRAAQKALEVSGAGGALLRRERETERAYTQAREKRIDQKSLEQLVANINNDWTLEKARKFVSKYAQPPFDLSQLDTIFEGNTPEITALKDELRSIIENEKKYYQVLQSDLGQQRYQAGRTIAAIEGEAELLEFQESQVGAAYRLGFGGDSTYALKELAEQRRIGGRAFTAPMEGEESDTDRQTRMVNAAKFTADMNLQEKKIREEQRIAESEFVLQSQRSQLEWDAIERETQRVSKGKGFEVGDIFGISKTNKSQEILEDANARIQALKSMRDNEKLSFEERHELWREAKDVQLNADLELARSREETIVAWRDSIVGVLKSVSSEVINTYKTWRNIEKERSESLLKLRTDLSHSLTDLAEDENKTFREKENEKVKLVRDANRQQEEIIRQSTKEREEIWTNYFETMLEKFAAYAADRAMFYAADRLMKSLIKPGSSADDPGSAPSLASSGGALLASMIPKLTTGVDPANFPNTGIKNPLIPTQTAISLGANNYPCQQIPDHTVQSPGSSLSSLASVNNLKGAALGALIGGGAHYGSYELSKGAGQSESASRNVQLGANILSMLAGGALIATGVNAPMGASLLASSSYGAYKNISRRDFDNPQADSALFNMAYQSGQSYRSSTDFANISRAGFGAGASPNVDVQVSGHFELDQNVLQYIVDETQILQKQGLVNNYG